MNSKKFLESYIKNYIKFLDFSNNSADLKKIIKMTDEIMRLSKKNKIIIAGNGGSASIASHFTVDLSKNTKIKCVNFNEPNLITCFANDFGYENWISNAVKIYANKKDILILISSSGKSRNILNAAFKAKKIGISKIFTFSGFEKKNPLRSKGDINIWIDSKNYNYVENLHQFYLLAIVDLIIKRNK